MEADGFPISKTETWPLNRVKKSGIWGRNAGLRLEGSYKLLGVTNDDDGIKMLTGDQWGGWQS
jgi:hypothetical protein